MSVHSLSLETEMAPHHLQPRCGQFWNQNHRPITCQVLENCIGKDYEVTVHWKGELFCSNTLNWDYKRRTVDLFMPEYIPKALTCFQHSPPSWPQHAPYKCAPIQYGETVPLAQPDKTSSKHSHFPLKKSNTFNKLLAHFFITHKLLTQL